ncbi:hypothetical protein F5884DRAFT_777984 [Xylogone sp. PMI_703]|nr:hypothetical protein F5884DRAFT_777984 [Xylogone sp. PMI_703]
MIVDYSASSIAERAKACYGLFTSVLEYSKEPTAEIESFLEGVSQDFQAYEAWANNSGAFHEAELTSSLAYRISDHETLIRDVTNMLIELQDFLAMALLILNCEDQDGQWDFSYLDNELPEVHLIDFDYDKYDSISACPSLEDISGEIHNTADGLSQFSRFVKKIEEAGCFPGDQTNDTGPRQEMTAARQHEIRAICRNVFRRSEWAVGGQQKMRMVF